MNAAINLNVANDSRELDAKRCVKRVQMQMKFKSLDKLLTAESIRGMKSDGVIGLSSVFIYKSTNKHAAKVMEAQIDNNNLLRW